MPQRLPPFRSSAFGRLAAHGVVVITMLGMFVASGTESGDDADLQLVTTARANSGASATEATPSPRLLPPITEPRVADRGSLSGRSSLSAPTPTPLPTPVPVDPNVTPLPGPVASSPAGPPQKPLPPASGPRSGLAYPVPGGSISQYFRAGHQGVDIAAAPGAAVVAAEAGVVTWAGWRNNGGGLVVEIDHANGLTTAYNHLGSVSVAVGQSVGRGSLIGGMGCTGVCYGPHVQFDVRVNGGLVDPLGLL